MADFFADKINGTLTHIKTKTVFALPDYSSDDELKQIIIKAMEAIENGTAISKTNART